MEEREIEEQRRHGEGFLGEWLLTHPNRFSPSRSGSDALTLGILSLVCLLPVGPLAVIRAVRCSDQRRVAGLSISWQAIAGAALGVAGTAALVTVLATLLLR